MTASLTATNHAMLFSSGPKVTARWCCRPTNYQLHFEPACRSALLCCCCTTSVSQESFHHTTDCWACAGNVLQPSSLLMSYLLLPDNNNNNNPLLLPVLLPRREHWWCGQLHLWEGAQCSDPALNLFCPLSPRPSSLHKHWPSNHSIIIIIVIICSLFSCSLPFILTPDHV